MGGSHDYYGITKANMAVLVLVVGTVNKRNNLEDGARHLLADDREGMLKVTFNHFIHDSST
jgi:hypothetical protein